MNFSSALQAGEIVVWNGELEKRKHDAGTRPAPPLAEESRPRMCIESHGRDEGSNVGEFSINNQRVIRALRERWGVKR